MDRIIENAVTGDRIHFWSSPMMGDGDELVFRGTLPGFGAGAPLHVHDEMTESFEVESGTLEIELGNGQKMMLSPGEQLTLAPGTPHGFRNPSAEEAIFVTTASPGIELERFLRSMYGLANEGLTNAAGAPRNPLAMAAVLERMDMTMVGVPRSVQRIAIGWLGAIARRTRITAQLDRHSSHGAA